MADEPQLWWHVRERLAAQAWSCDDTTWAVPAVGGTVGSLLARYAEAGLTTRLEVARSLQQLSEEHRVVEFGHAEDVTTAWLALRRIDAALGRPPIDLRSDVALFVGTRLRDDLVEALAAAGGSATVTISGPGFVAAVEVGTQPRDCLATMSWPTFVRLAAGTVAIVDSEIDLSGADAAINAFLDALMSVIERRQTSR
jgi:hypothetical protein